MEAAQSRQTKKYTFTLGRPPWYPSGATASDKENGTAHVTLSTSDKKSHVFQSLVLGVAGGTASGKSSVCEAIVKKLQVQWVSHLSLDSFYRGLGHDEDPAQHNWDHPDAFDWELVISTLKQLKAGKKVEVPIYDFVTHSRSTKTKTVYGADVILFEGILSFHDKELRDLMDIKIFVDEAADIRLARRIRRDIAERGRDVMGVIQQYERFVKPAHEDFVRPTMQYADIIVPKGKANTVAINLIAKHIESVLLERGFDPKQSRPPRPLEFSISPQTSPVLVSTAASSPTYPAVSSPSQSLLTSTLLGSANPPLPTGRPLEDGSEPAVAPVTLPKFPPSVHVMKQTAHLRALHTQLRNRHTGLSEFVFFTHRLSRLVIEEALNYLPEEMYQESVVTTPTMAQYRGVDIRTINQKVVFVSVMRAGEAMEEAAREVLFAAPIGKILIQSHGLKKPELFYFNFPKQLHERYVVVMDPTLATGEALKMAIRVLLDHHVPQNRILVATLVASPQGLRSLSACYPDVKFITSAVDEDLDDNFYLKPGIGNFGDRYFGS